MDVRRCDLIMRIARPLMGMSVHPHMPPRRHDEFISPSVTRKTCFAPVPCRSRRTPMLWCFNRTVAKISGPRCDRVFDLSFAYSVAAKISASAVRLQTAKGSRGVPPLIGGSKINVSRIIGDIRSCRGSDRKTSCCRRYRHTSPHQFFFEIRIVFSITQAAINPAAGSRKHEYFAPFTVCKIHPR